MQYGLDVSTCGVYSDPLLLAEMAVEAEAAGWDGFFIWDVLYAAGNPHLPVVDPWVALAAIAMRTKKIRIGAMITPLARRRPWQVARETAALDRLSNGRLIFGSGLGYQALEYEPFGEDMDPRARAEKLDEGLAVLDGLWRGGPLCFKGKHYRVNVEDFQPGPLQTPRIPVWIAGYWPNRRPYRRAARWDGVYIGTFRADGKFTTQKDVQEAVAYVKAMRESPEPFEVAFSAGPPDADMPYSEFVRSFQEAGVTWWNEGANDYVGPLAQIRERIRSGPPRV